MKTAIIYASTYGSTQKVAEVLHSSIKDSDIFNVKKENPNISSYDSVILGSSINDSGFHG
ncbi:MAG: hypothetical protein KMY54_04220 [Erysipelothrix sp.]|nr:hypothetical protein [Erysipelothrix sp.]